MKLPNSIEACHTLIRSLFEEHEKLRALIKKQSEILKAQEKMIKEQDEKIKLYELRIKEIEARLNQNSQNSSKPPSSDIFKRKKKKQKPGLPRKPKKQGGQKGHKGNTLKMVEAESVDDVIALKPGRCSCGKGLKCQGMEVHSRRQVFDIPKPKLLVTEYQQYSCTCPCCGKKNYGVYPEAVKAPTQYGIGIRSLVTLLSVKYHLSHQHISELLVDLYKHPINGATIQSSIKTASKQAEDALRQIKSELLKLDVLHVDETGIQVKAQPYWLHVASNEKWTYLYAHKNRGRKALEEGFSSLYNYTGTIIHDSWETYWGLKAGRHGLCGAHILRELRAQIEQGRKWAQRMYSLLLKLYEKYILGEEIHRRSYEWRLYKQIIKQALEEEAPPVKKKGARGRPKKTKGRNLAERLLKYQEEVLRFCREVNIPFTNNQAERDLRPAKGKLKVAGSFRSVHGAQHFARLQSIFSTWRKQGYHVFEELKTMMRGEKTAFLMNPT